MRVVDSFPENVPADQLPKIVAIDFDGVLHQYNSHWDGPDKIPDPPVFGSFKAIKDYIDAGFEVWIYSNRCNYDTGIKAMYNWFIEHSLERSYLDKVVFSKIKPAAILYIDDRSFQFTGNNWPTIDFIKNFRPWNKKAR